MILETNTIKIDGDLIADSLSVGVVALDMSHRVVLWNNFMSKQSGVSRDEALGKDIFDLFPYLPKNWLLMKFQSLIILKGYSFVSWRQRPYLFRFKTERKITGGSEHMFQDCTFVPILDSNGETTLICMTIEDVTEAAGAQRAVDELTAANKALQRMTNHDALTAIYNRGYIEKQLELEFSKSKRHGNVFSVVMFDLDYFKKVNDTYGHLGGDEVLKNVSRAVGEMLRNIDLLGRYGGEEFLMILAETGEQDAAALADRIRQAVEGLIITSGGHQIKTTVSMGVVEFRTDTKDYLQMIHEADIALYNSKKSGRNRVTRYVRQ
ncbi:MAG: diguanylate cyclase [Candidatus Magnetominusculus sp. LBB02]|nr:diguanylate cyclase [Candidatus Magnetominusculus sp. LBB02]